MTGSAIAPDFKATPYWWEALPERPGGEPPGLPAETDVAIVGSGLTGASAALTLARAGRRVHIFEAEEPGFGASTRNSGMIGVSLTVKPAALVARFGEGRTRELQCEAAAATRHMVEIIARERIDCHWEACGRFIGAETPAHHAKLARELDLMHSFAGIKGRMIERRDQRAEIGSDYYWGGMLLEEAGALHPGLYTIGLLDRATAAGATLLAHTPVTGIAKGRDGFSIETPRGAVRTRDVILATNGYTGAATPEFRRRLVPVEAGVTVSEPVSPELLESVLPTGRVLTDSKMNIYSARRSPDGTRLQFAAARGLFLGDERAKAAEIHLALEKVFPQAAHVRVAFCWTGLMGWSFDRLPHIGTLGGIHYAAGYCGSGVPMATWLGRKVALRILGEPEAETAFDGQNFPTRPFYRGNPWFLPLVVRYHNFRDRLDRNISMLTRG